MEHVEKLVGRNVAVAGRADQPVVLRGVPEQQHPVAGLPQAGQQTVSLRFGGEDHLSDLVVQRLVRLRHILKGIGAGLDDRLVFRLTEIKPVIVDIFFHHRIDEVRDVTVPVDVLTDLCGTDLLQFRGELQLHQVAGDGFHHLPVVLGVQRLIPDTAERDMVHCPDGIAHLRIPVERSAGNDVASHHQVDLPAGEQLLQVIQIRRISRIQRKIRREQVHMELIRHRHVDDLTADIMRLRLLGPGEFIHRQVDLEAHVADHPRNSLVGQREGIEGAREERHAGPHGQVKGSFQKAVLGDEPVQVRKAGRTVEMSQLIPAVFRQLEQDLPAGQCKDRLFLLPLQDPAAEHALAKDQHRFLADLLAIACHSGQKHSDHLFPAGGPDLLILGEPVTVGNVVFKHDADGVQRHGNNLVRRTCQQ